MNSEFVLEPRKKKDKSIKCRKCHKGGHEDVHCIVQVEEKFSCHICEIEDSDHDTLYCPYIDLKCKSCYMTGHSSEMCKLGSKQLDIAKIRPWRQDNNWGSNESNNSSTFYIFP